MSRIFNQLLNVKGTVVEDARIADSPLRPEPVLEIRVRPRAGMLRCSRCGERWHGYDQGGGARRWRGQDFGCWRVELVAACVCSIESGPCERVDVFHVSGRFWSTSACGEKRTPARPAWTSFPS